MIAQLYWFGTGTSIKSGGVKLILCSQTSRLCELILIVFSTCDVTGRRYRDRTLDFFLNIIENEGISARFYYDEFIVLAKITKIISTRK
jgi:hypothetical protein